MLRDTVTTRPGANRPATVPHAPRHAVRHRRGARPGGALLGVWAHPDDEAYMSAGLMAAVRRAGRRVAVLTMTAGERGTADPQRWPADRLGALRRHELRASLAALDVREHHVIGLPDGGCDRFDGTPLIEAAINALRPATIVTFGPEGFTGHPDHRAISAWTTRAWNAVGYDSELWYATVTPAFHAEHGALNDAVDLWSMGDGTSPCDREDAIVHQVRLSGHDLDQKVAALRAHSSQTDPLISAVGADAYRNWWSTESFIAAIRTCGAPAPPRAWVDSIGLRGEAALTQA